MGIAPWRCLNVGITLNLDPYQILEAAVVEERLGQNTLEKSELYQISYQILDSFSALQESEA